LVLVALLPQVEDQ